MPSLLLLAAVLTAAPPAQAAQPPQDRSAQLQLIGSPDLVRPADYPREALRQNRQGQVRFELDVDERGRVTGCTVQRSSGHALLDRAACDVYRTRARYTPARDAAGTATSAKDQRSVAWRVGTNGPEAVDIDAPDLIHGVRFVRAEDYPESAVSRNEQGSVTALVHVDAKGAIQSCTVEQSSGSTALDTRTCELLTARGRFEPARDEQGTALAGEFRQRINWRLESGPAFLLESATQMTLRYDAGGKVDLCRFERRMPGGAVHSESCSSGAPKYAPKGLIPQVAGGRALAISDHMTIVQEGRLAPLRPGERLLSQYRLRLSLDVQGKVTGCKVVSAEPQVDECRSMPPVLAPILVNGKAAAGTITMVSRHYLRFANAADAGPRLLNLNEVVTPDDYPAISADNEQEGRVTVRLQVDEQGLVSSCKVEKSSGHPPLDEQTCALFRARARFEPARDNRGRAVDSDFTQNLTWKLEGEPQQPSPRHAWMVRITVAMDKQGAMLDCKLESTGVPPSPHECESAVAIGKAAAAQGSGIAGFAISESYFYPVEPDKLAVLPELKDARNLARQVSRIVIEADGRVSDCEGMRYSGGATPAADACQILRFLRFAPAPAGSGPLVGTVVMTGYVRAHSIT